MRTQQAQVTTVDTDIILSLFGEVEKPNVSKFSGQSVETWSGFDITAGTIVKSINFALNESRTSDIPESITQNTSASLKVSYDEEIKSGVTQEFADSQGQHFNFLSYTEEDILDWHKWLEPEELVEFFEELLKLVTQISEGKEDAETLAVFLADWRETALINSEPDVLADIAEAERELDAGGGKPWSQIKKEIGL